jgi:hypothetical protein
LIGHESKKAKVTEMLKITEALKGEMKVWYSRRLHSLFYKLHTYLATIRHISRLFLFLFFCRSTFILFLSLTLKIRDAYDDTIIVQHRLSPGSNPSRCDKLAFYPRNQIVTEKK